MVPSIILLLLLLLLLLLCRSKQKVFLINLVGCTFLLAPPTRAVLDIGNTRCYDRTERSQRESCLSMIYFAWWDKIFLEVLCISKTEPPLEFVCQKHATKTCRWQWMNLGDPLWEQTEPFSRQALLRMQFFFLQPKQDQASDFGRVTINE